MRSVASMALIIVSRQCVIEVVLLDCVCCTRLYNWNSNHCLFSVLPSASTRVRHTGVAATAHSLEFEVSKCRTSQFDRCFLTAQVCMWEKSTGGWFPELCFFLFIRFAGACGVVKAINK